MSVIARTAGIGRSLEELHWDLKYLLQLWHAIEEASTSQKGAFLIYQEGSLVIRAIRDYFHPEIGEILIDTDAIFEQAQQFMAHVMPDNVSRVKRYRDDVPLFSRFQIEHQIETAYSPPGEPAGGRRRGDRPHRSAGFHRRQLGALHRAAATSRRPRSAPTLRRPRKSHASYACATWAA